MNLKKLNFLPFAAGIALTIVVGGGILLSQSGEDTPVAEANEILEVYQSLTPQAQALYYQQSNKLTTAVPERLVELDQLTIGCFGPSKIMSMASTAGNLGGQCCGVLKDADAYEAQLQALERFISENGDIELIPRDPYDVSVDHAKQLTALDQSVQLTPQQQVLYDEAMSKSHHGGPCCCKCWKWYVMSGLAKELIVEHDWTSDQIAELWDLSSSCGHDEDTNMHEHYGAGKDTNTHSIGHGENHSHETVSGAQLNAVVSMTSTPISPNAGDKTELNFTIQDEGGIPLALMKHHARQLHVVIVSEDKQVFGHIHPEDFGSSSAPEKNKVFFTFPASGRYLVAVDYMTDSGTGSKTFWIDVDGESLSKVPNNTDFSSSFLLQGNDRYIDPILLSENSENSSGYQVSINPPSLIESGKQTSIPFLFKKNGIEIDDLNPFLDAPLHVAVVSEDMSSFLHEHGELNDEGSHGLHHDNSLAEIFGPEINAFITFPQKGKYHLFTQARHDNQMIFSHFVVNVQ